MGTKFNGNIIGIPFIKVDYITKSDDYLYFISHIHTDHLSGLNTTTKLYCTEITATFLELKFKIPQRLLNIVKTTHIIKFKEQELQVTIIDAHHCPGSCMFLFEYNSIKVLYTGDCRLDGNYLRDNYDLFNSLSIDHLYFDNTFCSPRYYSLPTINESLHCLIRFLSKINTSTQVYIEFLFIGHELLFEVIYQQFKVKIHIDQEFYNLYKHIPCQLHGGYLSDMMTLSSQETRFHYCPKNLICGSKFKVHLCEFGCPHDSVIIRPSAMTFRSSIAISEDDYSKLQYDFFKSIPTFKDNLKKKCLVKSSYQSQHYYGLLFSLHPSTMEIDSFLKMIKVDKKHIYPIVEYSDFIHGNKGEYSDENKKHFLTISSKKDSSNPNAPNAPIAPIIPVAIKKSVVPVDVASELLDVEEFIPSSQPLVDYNSNDIKIQIDVREEIVESTCPEIDTKHLYY